MNAVLSDRTVDPDVFTASPEYDKRFSGDVGEYFLSVQWQAIERLLSKVLPGSGTRSVLEVGGGHLQTTNKLLALGHRVTVHASTPDALRKLAASPLATRIETLVCPIEKIGALSSRYDAVICLRLIPHVRDEAALIAALVSLARQAVIFDFASTRGLNSLSKLGFVFKRKIEKNTRPYFNHSPNHIRATLEKLCCGDIRFEGQFMFPMGLHRAIKKPALSETIESLLGFLRDSWGNPVICGARKS